MHTEDVNVHRDESPLAFRVVIVMFFKKQWIEALRLSDQ